MFYSARVVSLKISLTTNKVGESVILNVTLSKLFLKQKQKTTNVYNNDVILSSI